MKSKARKNKIIDEQSDNLCVIPKILEDKCKNEEISSIVKQFNNAVTVEIQIDSVHKLSSLLSREPCEETQLILTILLNLFMHSSPKSAVKRCLLRIFIKAKKYNEFMAKDLSQQLLEFITTVKTQENNIQRCNDCVNSINDCFNNFSAGVAAVTFIVKDVFDFLIQYLKVLVDGLSNISSPIKLQEYYNLIHNNTRALVAVTQQCDNIDSIIESYMSLITEYCIKLFKNHEIFFDTKNNCSIILITAVNYSEKNGFKTILQIVFKEPVITNWNINFENINNEITLICIFMGVLNTVEAKILCSYKDSFKDSYIYKISEELFNMAKLSADKPSVVLGANRALALVSRSVEPLNNENLLNLLNKFLDHMWTQLGHYVDTVRHVAKSILVNLIKISVGKSNLGCNQPLDLIINSTLNFDSVKEQKYAATSILATEIGCEILLSIKPDLVNNILPNSSTEFSQHCYASSCYENLMRRHEKETDQETWFKTWVKPLMSKFHELKEVDDYGTCLQNLMIMAITFQPKIIDALITDWCQLPLNIVKLNAILNSTLVIRRRGILISNIDVNKWRGLLDYSILETAKCHSNDQIRIASLSLIADSHKSTEIFNEFEYQFVLSFFHYNISTLVPSIRQQILFLLKKILARFTESYHVITRDFIKINNSKINPEQQIVLLQNQKQYYEKFILNLRNSVFDNLFPHANYSRRTICLETLILIEEICCEISKHSHNNLNLNSIWMQSEADAILNCLSDTYENNQILAVKILQNCPVELLKLQDTENTKNFIDNSLKLAISVKPAEAQTAAYMFETCLNSPVLQELLSCNEEITCKNYLLMKVIFVSLQKQVEIGKISLLKAASSNPMHGTLFCLRHLIENHLFVLTLNEQHWKTFIEETIQICFDVSDIAGPIVNSSSPEGHLPMDNYSCSDANDEEVVTSQMLLVCCWRSIKEVSLLLGQIVLQSTIVGENEHGLITPEQILKIGEHFITLLTETKHRGAFEQAYVGFSKLCTRLWKCKSQVLHQLPVNWLFDIINAISGNNPKQNTKLCATRRSAGVPFMIQAITASELQTGGSNNFHSCMTMLLKFADHPGDNVEMRTHSMNILRALYRHTQLGEEISPYVADGVVAAINGFTKKTWAERNAATVLFSSLMTRIFGVQRSKDSDKISIRNQMTTRVFFLRYPSLHNFLLNKLIDLTDPNCNDVKFVALYSILLLLARLYPSNSDGHETDNLLQVFVPHVKQCAYNKDLQIRKLSAKALIPLVPNETKHLVLKELFSNLHPKNTPNYIHGTLLQIFYLMRTLNKTNNYTEFNSILKNSSWLIKCNGLDNCALITSLYMKMLTICLSKFECLQNETKFLNHLLHIIFEQNETIQNNCIIGKSTYFLNSTELSFYLAYYVGDLNLSEFLLTNLQHKNTAVVEFTVNFLLQFLNSSENNISYILGQIDNIISVEESNNNLIELYKNYSLQILAGLKAQFKPLIVIINKLLLCKNFTAKGLLVLSYFQHELVEEFNKYPGRLSGYWSYLKKSLNETEQDEIACAIIICMHKYLINISLQDRIHLDFSQVFERIVFYASPEQYEICKYAIAMMLIDEKLSWLLFAHEIIGMDNVFINWHIVILLIMDEDAIIRETICQLTRKHILPEKAKEILLIDFIKITQPISEEKCLAYLLFWSTMDLETLDSPDDLEMQIFEKNGTSLTVEDVHLNRLVAKSLKNILTSTTESDFISNLNRVIIILKKEQLGFVANNLIIELLEQLQKHLLQVQNISENLFYSAKEFIVNSNMNSVYKYKVFNIVKYLSPSNLVWVN